ncbi:hypothetical protein YC2023_052240 [Brassica napus]
MEAPIGDVANPQEYRIPMRTCDITIDTRRFRCDKSGSARRTTLGYNGWERTTSTTSRAMIGGSFIKEDMVRPKDSGDEDRFGVEYLNTRTGLLDSTSRIYG